MSSLFIANKDFEGHALIVGISKEKPEILFYSRDMKIQ